MGLAAWPLPAAWATSYGLVFAVIAGSITAVCSLSFLARTNVALLLLSLLLYCAAELAFGLLVREQLQHSAQESCHAPLSLLLSGC